PLSPDYVSGPEYPEYLALSDKEVPVEDRPYVVADSPIALSPGYVADSDPEEDHADYPADGGDDNDEPSDDDDDDDTAEDTEAFETNEVAPTPVPSPRQHTAR
ncbi:hypothetical protein Tco_0463426, partial [Tanacetum coccineum]